MINHKNIKKNVLALCSQFPHLKDNYNELVGYYWVIYDHVGSLNDYGNATPVESITRNFRYLVDSGLIQLSRKSKAARDKKEKEYRHEFVSIG